MAITSLALGSVFGFGSKMLESWNKRGDRKHEIALANLAHTQNKEMLNLEASVALQKTDMENLGKSVVSQDAQIEGSMSVISGAGPKVRGWVSFWLGNVIVANKSVRIVLAYSLFAAACFTIIELHGKVDGLDAFGEKEVVSMYKMSVLSLFDMMELALSYWFCSRPTSSWKSFFGYGKKK